MGSATLVFGNLEFPDKRSADRWWRGVGKLFGRFGARSGEGRLKVERTTKRARLRGFLDERGTREHLGQLAAAVREAARSGAKGAVTLMDLELERAQRIVVAPPDGKIVALKRSESHALVDDRAFREAEKLYQRARQPGVAELEAAMDAEDRPTQAAAATYAKIVGRLAKQDQAKLRRVLAKIGAVFGDPPRQILQVYRDHHALVDAFRRGPKLRKKPPKSRQ
jgi:hypothetical protein